MNFSELIYLISINIIYIFHYRDALDKSYEVDKEKSQNEVLKKFMSLLCKQDTTWKKPLLYNL